MTNTSSKTATHAPPVPPSTRPKHNTACIVHAAYDFDVMVPGHLTRLGTKADVQVYIDFFQQVLEGGKYGIAEAPSSLSIAGTGIFTPGNVNSGILWCDGPLNPFGTGCTLLP